MSNQVVVDEYNRLGATNMICKGGGTWLPVCCGRQHESCKYGAGSLYCVKDPCGNPHHRGQG